MIVRHPILSYPSRKDDRGIADTYFFPLVLACFLAHFFLQSAYLWTLFYGFRIIHVVLSYVFLQPLAVLTLGSVGTGHYEGLVTTNVYIARLGTALGKPWRSAMNFSSFVSLPSGSWFICRDVNEVDGERGDGIRH